MDKHTEVLEGMGAPCIAGRDVIPPGAHLEIKFRGPDGVVFDISIGLAGHRLANDQSGVLRASRITP